MSIPKNTKQEIIKNFSTAENDTGSPEVQCALLTHDIESLTEHLKNNKKDFQSRRGLLAKVVQRRRLLKYLLRKSVARYHKLIKILKLRK